LIFFFYIRFFFVVILWEINGGELLGFNYGIDDNLAFSVEIVEILMLEFRFDLWQTECLDRIQILMRCMR
jgi:hypothetical protein